MENIRIFIRELKEQFGVVSLRADMSSEISSVEELQILKGLSFEVGLDLTVKVGGCDAITDISIAKESGANCLIAPMVETEYALQKFVNACNYVYDDLDKINLYINIETGTSYNNLNSILSSPYMKFIKGVVVGRDDMAKSLNIPLEYINSDKMLEITKNIAEKTRRFNKDFIVGGGIRPQSAEFINSVKNIYLTKYETRRIVFDGSEILKSNANLGIKKAVEFEKIWLAYRNSNIKSDLINTEKRIQELNFSL